MVYPVNLSLSQPMPYVVFANFASIGIQIGGIGAIAPGQRRTLSELGIKALIGGTVACLMTAAIAGFLT